MLLTLISRLLLRLLPLMALLCAALPVFGGRPPAADEAWENLGFTACDLPCFAGITPGETPFQETPDLLQQYIPLIGRRLFDTGTVINFSAAGKRAQISGWVGNRLNRVGEMRLNVLLPLDHLIAQLGTPDCVLPGITGGAEDAAAIFWIRGRISIGARLGINQPVFDPNARVSELWLSAADPHDCGRPGALPWHGFGLIAAYGR